MGDTDPHPTDSEAGEECTTTGSFADHGIDDGTDLLQGTYYRLTEGDEASFEPTEAFFDRLEAAFIWTYLATVETAHVPAAVAASIDDAKALTAAEFRDEPGADLRTEVVPAFYRRVAGFHCAYRE